ncbi:hypothetical protein C8R45DRAFT_410484 [Mycena sanguinolenta]|nr:hypothetical protein C8R45DRAFT_410484 [Mycena sanguinolenta]
MSSSSSSHTSSAQSTSSGNGSSASTNSATSSASSTSDPISSPTQQPPPPGGGGGSGGGGGGGSGIQSSLYLYTFLATLILLLSVSSAIVIRSLLLRRRHRRMVAEAIANGTWIPPARRVKVDLRKKPRLRDAWVEPPLLRGDKEMDWDTIMPFAASYSPPAVLPPSTAAIPAAVPARNVSSTTLSLSRQATPLAAAEPEPMPMLDQPRVRVAVLIAMPAPGIFATTEPQTPTWTRAPSWDAYLSPPDDDDEVGLPHLEMGVASVGVVAAHEDCDGDGAKEPMRDSEDGPST